MHELQVTDADYRTLAEFRHRIRDFLATSAQAARSAGLEPEQFQLLLAVRGMPPGAEASIHVLAEQLYVNHNTAVERIDRLAQMGLVRRAHSAADHRVVLVELSPRGRATLEKLARQRLEELRADGPRLIESLRKVLAATQRISGKKRTAGRPRGRNSRGGE
jgi:DNA-binding MarR family transcriptional regulator